MKIVDYRNIPYSEVKKILERLREEGVELDQLAMSVLEYVSKFSKCSNAEELVSELLKLGLKEITAVLIANLKPTSLEELRILLTFEPEAPEKDVLENIISIVNKYCE